MDRRSWILVTAVGAIWGASFLFIEIGIRDMSPAVVAWARVALGGKNGHASLAAHHSSTGESTRKTPPDATQHYITLKRRHEGYRPSFETARWPFQLR